jgi:hypothetical protein
MILRAPPLNKAALEEVLRFSNLMQLYLTVIFLSLEVVHES